MPPSNLHLRLRAQAKGNPGTLDGVPCYDAAARAALGYFVKRPTICYESGDL